MTEQNHSVHAERNQLERRVEGLGQDFGRRLHPLQYTRDEALPVFGNQGDNIKESKNLTFLALEPSMYEGVDVGAICDPEASGWNSGDQCAALGVWKTMRARCRQEG